MLGSTNTRPRDPQSGARKRASRPRQSRKALRSRGLDRRCGWQISGACAKGSGRTPSERPFRRSERHRSRASHPRLGPIAQGLPGRLPGADDRRRCEDPVWCGPWIVPCLPSRRGGKHTATASNDNDCAREPASHIHPSPLPKPKSKFLPSRSNKRSPRTVCRCSRRTRLFSGPALAHLS